MNHSIFLLSGRDDAAFPQKIKQIAPHIEIVSPAMLKENPDLLSQIEIAYDGLRGDDLARATSLKWLQNSGAGVDGLPLHDLEKRGVLVTNVSGIHARCIAEHLFGMLLSVTHQLDTARAQQEKHEWKHLGGNVISLYGKTLGILGAGEIGNQIARVGRAFEMKPIGLRRGGKPTPEIETMFSPDTRLEFFAQSPIVMNVLPLTESTRGFMGDAEFDALPDGAILLNAGRGATIDTEALMRAAKRKTARRAFGCHRARTFAAASFFVESAQCFHHAALCGRASRIQRRSRRDFLQQLAALSGGRAAASRRGQRGGLLNAACKFEKGANSTKNEGARFIFCELNEKSEISTL